MQIVLGHQKGYTKSTHGVYIDHQIVRQKG